MNTLMDRRQFMKSLGGVGVALATPSLVGCQESPYEVDLALLTDFLTNQNNQVVDREGIENTLYDISKLGKKDWPITIGRSSHIGGDYFLTAEHVVDAELSRLRLIPQSRRGHVRDYRKEFEVVERDKELDLALLKVKRDSPWRTEENYNPGKAKLRLASTIPASHDELSTFIRLTGTPPSERYEFEYGGVDFYDTSKEIANLGKWILPAHSLLLERRGRVWRYDEEHLKQFSGYEGNPEDDVFTSVASYHGESGQPMFAMIEDGKYVFTGIITHGYGVEHVIPTPNNPLRYTAVQQIGAFFSHRNSVEKLINKHIQRLSLER